MWLLHPQELVHVERLPDWRLTFLLGRRLLQKALIQILLLLLLIVNAVLSIRRYESVNRVCCVHYGCILWSNLQLLLLLPTRVNNAAISHVLLWPLVVSRRIGLLWIRDVRWLYHFVRTISRYIVVMVTVCTRHQPILHCLMIKGTLIVLWAASVEYVWVAKYLSALYSRSIALLLILLFY